MNKICQNCRLWEIYGDGYGYCSVKYDNQKTSFNHRCDEIMCVEHNDHGAEQIFFFREKEE